MMFNFQTPEISYFKVTQEHITSININISFLKNISYIFEFNKEDINITLNFRKIKCIGMIIILDSLGSMSCIK